MASTSTNLINSEIKAASSSAESSSQAKPPEHPETTNELNLDNNLEITKPTEKELNSIDKVERAKQLIEEKRELKRIEEEETQRKKEIERRKMGQEIQKMRRQQQDQEMKQIREELLREKNEEMAARQKILAQIEQDKEERAKKFNQSNHQSINESSPPVESPKSVPRQTNSARLQFRFADGTSHTKDFLPTNTLQEIRSYVQQNLNLPYRNFDLSTTFPRRQFSIEDNTKTLADLELIPNAVILVVPVTGVDVTPASPVPGMLSSFIWFLLSPVVGIYNFLHNRFSNWRNPRPAPFKRPSEDTAPSGSNGPSYPKRRIPPDSTVIRRQGNIHRLGDRKEDSDDDNNTWNGNSTQQM